MYRQICFKKYDLICNYGRYEEWYIKKSSNVYAKYNTNHEHVRRKRQQRSNDKNYQIANGSADNEFHCSADSAINRIMDV